MVYAPQYNDHDNLIPKKMWLETKIAGQRNSGTDEDQLGLLED
jgi:hypothetical protein